MDGRKTAKSWPKYGPCPLGFRFEVVVCVRIRWCGSFLWRMERNKEPLIVNIDQTNCALNSSGSVLR